MALYSRSGRPRPQSGGFELAAWYFMRLSGVALFVLALAHFSLVHFLFDPSQAERDLDLQPALEQPLLAQLRLAAADDGRAPRLPGHAHGDHGLPEGWPPDARPDGCSTWSAPWSSSMGTIVVMSVPLTMPS